MLRSLCGITLIILLGGTAQAAGAESDRPIVRELLRAPLKAMPAERLRGNCAIAGSVRNLPDYLMLKVSVREKTTGVAELEIPPGTSRRDFRFDGLRCNEPGTEVRAHHLFYKIRRLFGDREAPRWSSSRDGVSYAYPGAYGFLVNLNPGHRLHTDEPRDFSRVVSSGLLISNLHTDQESYRMGDVIELGFDAAILGPAGAVERADYVVSVRAGGFEHEVARGRLEVPLGETVPTRARIHHTQYSRGRVAIDLAIDAPDYQYRGVLYRTVD